MNALIVSPILIPLATAIACLMAWQSRSAQRALALCGAGALLVVALLLLSRVEDTGIHAEQMGAWASPFGITIVADLFSAIMVLVAAVMSLAVTLYSLWSIDKERESFGYYPLLNILLMGVCGAFLTGDLFNLYVWFEVMLMSSFVLLAHGGERPQMEGALKYVSLNLISSALFLAAVGLLYGMCGTLNMADLSRKLSTVQETGLVTILAALFFVAFGIKSAVFPLFFWLPASYHTPPAAISAIFAGLLTKVGVYSLIRVYTLVFANESSFIQTLVLVVAGLTMVTGVLGAAAQSEFRRILSFHIVSQIGYMLMGLGLMTKLALSGAVFYIVHHIIVKTNLFLVSGVVQRLGGSYDLKKLGGLCRERPAVAILFLIPALSLAGLPPLSGFFAKLVLVQAGLEVKQYAIVTAALAVSFLTLFSMTKIWNEAFWKSPESEQASDVISNPSPGGPSYRSMLIPIVALATLTVCIGFAAEPLFRLTGRAAAQLIDPTEYIRAVLGP